MLNVLLSVKELWDACGADIKPGVSWPGAPHHLSSLFSNQTPAVVSETLHPWEGSFLWALYTERYLRKLLSFFPSNLGPWVTV